MQRKGPCVFASFACAWVLGVVAPRFGIGSDFISSRVFVNERQAELDHNYD